MKTGPDLLHITKRISQLFRRSSLFLLALNAAGQGLSPNLVQNGSFELVGHTLDLSPWHNGGGGRPSVGMVVAEPWWTPDGSNFVVAQSYICQDLPTVAGQHYLLRFAFGGNDQLEINSGPLHVNWGNQELVTIPITPVNLRYPRWRYFDFLALAATNSTRIAFSTQGKEAFPYIDDVQVTAVPGEWMALPQSQTAEEGATATFRFETISSIQGAVYQWFFEETNLLVDATNTFLKLTNIRPAQTGAYAVVVSNSALVVTSAPAKLSIIPSVAKRTVPVLWAQVLINFTRLHFEYADGPGARWVPLLSMVQTNGKLFFVDRSPALPEQRLYRVWANDTPSLWVDATTAIYLYGSVGTKLQIDYLNAIGPPDAWLPLDTVTLTNPAQLYSNDAMLGKIGKLYRVVPVP